MERKELKALIAAVSGSKVMCELWPRAKYLEVERSGGRDKGNMLFR